MVVLFILPKLYRLLCLVRKKTRWVLEFKAGMLSHSMWLILSEAVSTFRPASILSRLLTQHQWTTPVFPIVGLRIVLIAMFGWLHLMPFLPICVASDEADRVAARSSWLTGCCCVLVQSCHKVFRWAANTQHWHSVMNALMSLEGE